MSGENNQQAREAFQASLNNYPRDGHTLRYNYCEYDLFIAFPDYSQLISDVRMWFPLIKCKYYDMVE